MSRKPSKSKRRRSKRVVKTKLSNDSNPFNQYFNKVYVVSLFDKDVNYKEVSDQLKANGIKHEKFVAIDGRGNLEEKEIKRKEFEKLYNVRIPKKGANIPASSLTIGNILMYREMVKNNWDRILILEDDIILEKDINEKFLRGINSLKNYDWDLLYLSCGGECGNKGVSNYKTKKNKHLSTWLSHKSWEPDMSSSGKIWVNHPYDIRTPCPRYVCERVSKYISTTPGVGGTFGYAISLKGAKKMLKYIGKTINNHIDQYLKLSVQDGVNNGISFDPPILWHKWGLAVAGSNTIEWV